MQLSPREHASIPQHIIGGDRWFGADAFAHRILNVRFRARDGYSSAVIDESPDPRVTVSDQLVAILAEAQEPEESRLLIENRSGKSFEQKDFPFALSRLMDTTQIRQIAVVQPEYGGNRWTRLDIAFGRAFNVAVRLFSNTTEALGWLSPS